LEGGEVVYEDLFAGIHNFRRKRKLMKNISQTA
jgi:hypothetical protein